jgi:small conductance mechanosensitive channel
MDIGVAYKEDTDRVAEVMKSVAEELRADPAFRPKILGPLEVFGVDEFADSAVILKARIRTQPIEQWAVGREYRRRLKKAFDAEGIEIPFPHLSLYAGADTKPLPVEVPR